MENEAQLAFILCHELTHIQEQHSLEFYLETHGVSTTSSRDVLKKEQFDKKLFSKVSVRATPSLKSQKGYFRQKCGKSSSILLMG
jgi:Zn-dependent protease with chaperone function